MDVLSWDKFLEESLLESTYPPPKIKLYNRLVAHTDNFFIIALSLPPSPTTSIFISLLDILEHPRQDSNLRPMG